MQPAPDGALDPERPTVSPGSVSLRAETPLPSEAARRAHDVINLVLAARLRLDAIRAVATDSPDIAVHLAAIEACLERIVLVVRSDHRAAG